MEIDPQLTELAKKYFRLEENPRLNIYHEDGRTFLNKNTYNMMYFGDFSFILFNPLSVNNCRAIQKCTTL